MTTREAVGVKLAEAKERKGWGRIRAVVVTVAALPLLLVAALVEGATMGGEEHGDGFD